MSAEEDKIYNYVFVTWTQMFRLNSDAFGIDQVQLDEITVLCFTNISRDQCYRIGAQLSLPLYRCFWAYWYNRKLHHSRLSPYMNDSQEYEYVNILYKAWEVIYRNVVDERQRIFLNYVEPYLKPGAMTLEDYFPVHIICFSTRNNDLSQWRAYGGGEGGFSIGFETSGLARMISGRFAYTSSVIYDEKEQHRFVEKLLQNTVCLYSKHARERGSGSDGFLMKCMRHGEQQLPAWHRL